jgi:hypothetical protein
MIRKNNDILVFDKYYYFVLFAVTFLNNLKQLNYRFGLMNKKIILYFCFLISTFCFVGLTSCSSPTSTPKGSLTGVVHLENQQDHSNITVALYDLATLDPDIVDNF